MNHERDRNSEAGPESGRAPFSDTRELHPAASGRTSSAPSNSEPWAVRLLDLATHLPLDEGLEVVTQRCVSVVSELLPECTVGVRVARPARGEWLVLLAANSTDRGEASPDAPRMFPDLKFERVERLEEPFGSTLHVASECPAVLETDAHEAEIAKRGAAVLRVALQGARAEEFGVISRREIERLQVRVIQGEKLASLGQIVANLVHELNNPLTSILAQSEYLKRHGQRRTSDEELALRLGRIGEAADRALKFARDLMDYAKPSTEAPVAVALADVVERALAFCDHEFSTRQIEVLRDLGEEPPYVHGIAGHLMQVFVNLFVNAAQAMPDGGGQLRVSLSTRGADVLAEVSDTGVGIESKCLTRVFEPYFTTRHGDCGTGLGLAIVRDIVSAHGGSLTARSHVGKGTTFSFTLPRATGL